MQVPFTSWLNTQPQRPSRQNSGSAHLPAHTSPTRSGTECADVNQVLSGVSTRCTRTFGAADDGLASVLVVLAHLAIVWVALAGAKRVAVRTEATAV